MVGRLSYRWTLTNSYLAAKSLKVSYASRQSDLQFAAGSFRSSANASKMGGGISGFRVSILSDRTDTFPFSSISFRRLRVWRDLTVTSVTSRFEVKALQKLSSLACFL